VPLNIGEVEMDYRLIESIHEAYRLVLTELLYKYGEWVYDKLKSHYRPQGEAENDE
jgi:hypothetical protein